MMKYYLHFKENQIIGCGQCKCYNEDFECREVTEIEYQAYQKTIKEKQVKQQQIEKLTKKLQKTDYIANKLAEANAEYIVTEDKTKLIELRTKYAKELADRETWRNEIDSLQEKIKKL